MKFDNVIMNPPFSKDKDFIALGLKLGEHVVSITPASWLFSVGKVAHRPEFKKRLKKVIVDDNRGQKYFSANPDSLLAVASFQEESDGFVLQNGVTDFCYQYENDESLSQLINNISAKSIAKKISNANKNTPEVTKRWAVHYRRKLSMHLDTRGVPGGRNFYQGIVNSKTIPIKSVAVPDAAYKTGCLRWYSSKAEAQNAIDFYSLAPLKIYLTSIARLGGGAGKRMVEQAPVVDFKKAWTREMVQSYFGITDKEWEYAERVVQGVSLDEIE